jgi:cellulose synthase (UDP-forming)
MSKTIHHNRGAQALGVLLILCIAWFLPWLVAHADLAHAWLSLPFLAATAVVVAALLVSVCNRWERAVPVSSPVPAGAEPRVAVIVPTLGEPLELLERTVRSVLDQDWPQEHLWVLVSDDAHDPRVHKLVNRLALAYPKATLRYHRPPAKDDPRRNGEAKAGNLNSALTRIPAEIELIETRDADDLVGDRRFLRETVGQLVVHERLAFVQTLKSGEVYGGDPFDNLQPHFFACAMASRYAANAVFPCGSGVVWRRAALADIGDFPTWNLVEDLQSGIEALRRGWDGCYLPIVGAHAQHTPEDLPNFVKQRGTWALDTMRLMMWAPKSGLSLRQRLQFYELALFYLQGPATLVFLITPALGFALHDYPVVTSTGAFLLHFWPFAAALELYMAAVHRPLSFEQLWRARLVWAGLSFTYARAFVLAVRGGRDSKPRYVVTRKENQHAWHWRLALPHMVLLATLAATMGWSLAHHSLLNSFDVSSAYWVVLYSVLLLGFVRLSWHGVSRPSLRGSLMLQRALRFAATVVSMVLVLALCSSALGATGPQPARGTVATVTYPQPSGGAVSAGRPQPSRETRATSTRSRPARATMVTVQRLFHVLGYPLDGERVGTFGVHTKGALSYFQRKYRLPVTGYPDERTVAEMQAVAASLTAAPAGARAQRDLVDRLLGGVPIVPLGLACAAGLSLLALTARRRDALPDR